MRKNLSRRGRARVNSQLRGSGAYDVPLNQRLTTGRLTHRMTLANNREIA